jgi:hypothetical protein
MTERDPELQDDPRLRSIDASLVSYLDSTDGDPSSGFADSVSDASRRRRDLRSRGPNAPRLTLGAP